MNTMRHLELELCRLRTENTQLRKSLRLNGRHSRRIQRAYDNALLLATWHVAYLPTTREFAKARGMAQRAWENAMGLLKLARLVNGQRWTAHDLGTIEERLQQAAERATVAPEAFFVRLNRHARS